jgi:hypothetical protein
MLKVSATPAITYIDLARVLTVEDKKVTITSQNWLYASKSSECRIVVSSL